jgi:hypothetical protein
MNTASFEPTNPLEVAMRAAALDPADFDAFLAALAAAKLIVPVPELPDENGQVGFALIERDGADHIAVFTSDTQRRRAHTEGHHRIELAGRDLARMWPPGVAMAINPGGDLGLSLPEGAVAALAGPEHRVGEQTLPAGSEITVGAPANEPQELLDRLTTAAAQMPEISALHRALFVARGGGARPQFAIGVQLSPAADDAQDTLRRLAEVAGPNVGLLALGTGHDDLVARWMLDTDEPFYRSADRD